MASLYENISWDFQNIIRGVRSPETFRDATKVIYLGDLTINGSGFTYSVNGELTGGTITEIITAPFNGLTRTATLFVSIAATDWRAAVDATRANQNAPNMANLFAQQQWTMTGQNDASTFVGGNFADNIFAGYGDDVIVGGPGNDTLNGGFIDSTDFFGNGSPDFDVLSYDLESGSLGVIVNLAANTATDTFGNTDTVFNFEAVFGTAQNDSIVGSNNGDQIDGRAGNDTLDGGGGFDEVRYTRENGPAGVVVNLGTGIATDSFGITDTIKTLKRYAAPRAAIL